VAIPEHPEDNEIGRRLPDEFLVERLLAFHALTSRLRRIGAREDLALGNFRIRSSGGD